MSDWQECPNLQECTEGNRFGKGCVADPTQSAMGGKPWHECHCGVDSDGNPPNLRQADTITALRAENERLRVENIQMQAALGYGILAEDERHILPSNPFKCGTCDASKHLRAEVETMRAALILAREYVLVQSCGLSLMPDDAAKDLKIIDDALEENTSD